MLVSEARVMRERLSPGRLWWCEQVIESEENDDENGMAHVNIHFTIYVYSFTTRA